MRRRHALSLLATSLTLSLPAWAATAPPSESERFHQWLDAQWELTLQRRPVLATSLGDPRYNDRLPDTTTAAYRAQSRRELRQTLKALASSPVPSKYVALPVLRLRARRLSSVPGRRRQR